MRSLLEYRDIEHTQRGDLYEGYDIWMNPDISRISIDNRLFTKSGGTLSVALSFHEDIFQNVFCATMIENNAINNDGIIIDRRLIEFGDYCLLIKSPSEFLKKVEKAINNNPEYIKFTYGEIEYVSKDNYDGELGPFRKIDNYKHQKEWRILVESKSLKSPFIINIGSINDITKIYEAKEFIKNTNKYLNFRI